MMVNGDVPGKIFRDRHFLNIFNSSPHKDKVSWKRGRIERGGFTPSELSGEQRTSIIA
jgi:hypothetical protein